MNLLEQAYEIAKKELRDCYDKFGIVAGRHHFSDYWGRDGFFGALGSLELGDLGIVRKQIDLFYKNQRADGLIPYRLMNGPVNLGKYLGKKQKKYDFPRPNYRLRNIFQEIFDGTTLAIIFFSELGLMGEEARPDRISETKKALRYLDKKERNGLLWDGIMAEWNDTAYKFGNLLYSNVLYLKALSSLNLMLDKIKASDPEIKNKERQISQNLRRVLWNGKYFADWRDYKRQDYFYPFGNLLAVCWGLTTPAESQTILEECRKVKAGFTLETNSPRYPFFRIDLLQHLIGMGDYQNKSSLWWQPACAYAVALTNSGNKKQAREQLQLMAKRIVANQGVYECYDRSGIPLKRLFYKSEHPFAWSAGMFVWAVNQARKHGILEN